ncbi:uncharacterized protein LOC119737769 [Patiria miniata]|uniref:THAP-type domain-containing protein n=1 Tax=Patiria miniata TaxID=46514 RepID=A0A914AYF5_PATMI|nr:uncharacterized protein LOC119737769 [Patiria miniata]
MGGGDHCAVLGCNNDRRYPERYVIKEHVNTLRFHSCRDKKYFPLWTRLIQRKDFRVKASTTVCSNHFKYGQPYPDELHPSLFLRGYDLPETPKRAPVKRRALDVTTPQPKKIRTLPYRSIGIQVNPGDIDDVKLKALENDHNYVHLPFRNKPVSPVYVAHLEDELAKLTDNCGELRRNLLEAKSNIDRLKLEAQAKTKQRFSIRDICHSNELIKLYTGLPRYQLFEWLFEEIKPHTKNMHYYKGKRSAEDKAYQLKNSDKPGRKRSQALEDELLMTLMKLRLNLREDDLAFRFGVSQSTVSQVISTWLPLVDRELT